MSCLRRFMNLADPSCQGHRPSHSRHSSFENFGGTTVKGHSHYFHTRKSANVLANTAFALGPLCALVITLLMPCLSYSQDTGYISGTVIDKSGAAVAGADITLTNTTGSLTRTTTSNNDGAYVIAGLPGDTYNLSVAAKGFQKYTAQSMELNGRNFTQLVNLAPGVVNQTGQDEGTVGVYGNVAYSMNGGRTEYNNWELDGGDN